MAASIRRVRPTLVAAIAFAVAAAVISFVPWRIFSFNHGRVALWLATDNNRLLVVGGVAGPAGVWYGFSEQQFPNGTWSGSFGAYSKGSDYMGHGFTYNYPFRPVFSRYLGVCWGGDRNRSTGYNWVQIPSWPFWLAAALFLRAGWPRRRRTSHGFEVFGDAQVEAESRRVGFSPRSANTRTEDVG